VFINTPMARRQWTGLDDEHLASIGFINFGWNALERKFASLVWVTAGWDQEVGEVVLAALGNVSLVKLFMNLMRQELQRRPDKALSVQAAQTGVLYDAIREARNDVVHCFFHFDPTHDLEGHYKTSARKTAAGTAELRTVAMGKADIDDLCVAISDCIESVDDLVLKMWFRRRFQAAGDATGAWEDVRLGWDAAPFDIRRLRAYPKKRERRHAAERAGGRGGDPG